MLLGLAVEPRPAAVVVSLEGCGVLTFCGVCRSWLMTVVTHPFNSAVILLVTLIFRISLLSENLSYFKKF